MMPEMTKVSSSLIAAIGFSEGRLHVEFKKNPVIYVYIDVEPETHEALLSAKSIGAYFVKHIRGVYPHYIRSNE